jgi:hypothetical protein
VKPCVSHLFKLRLHALYSTIRINVLELLYEIQVYELNSRGTCSVLDYK